MSDFQRMVKQAQRMQQEIEKAQGELNKLEAEFSSNGVKAVVRGDFSVVSITINEELLKEGDKAMLEDVITAAVNGAVAKARAEVESRMSTITGGLRIPGMF